MDNNCPQKQLKTIGDYDIGKTIGEGFAGFVRLSTHKKNGKKYAMKIINIEDPEFTGLRKQRLWREINISKRLSHPNITVCIFFVLK